MIWMCMCITIIGYMHKGILGFLLQCISIISLFKINNKNKTSIIENLISLLILSIPTSFINIFGGEYGKLPISLFNVIVASLVLYLIYMYYSNKLKFKLDFFNIVILLVLVFFLVPVSIASDKIDAIKDYITGISPLIILIFLRNNKNITIKYKDIETLYIDMVLATSISLLYQIILSKYIGIDIGRVGYYEGNRIAYGIIFSDYSFLSLYLSSGASILLIKYLKNKNIMHLAKFAIIIISAVLTTSRTGIAAFGLSIFTYIVLKMICSNKSDKVKYLKIIPFIIVGAIVAVGLIMKLRPTQSIFSGSGRIKEYILGIKVFIQNPIWGIGLGGNSFLIYIKEKLGLVGYAIPHNLFIMMLVQSGVICTSIITIFIYKVIEISKKNDALFLSIVTTFIGAQFIPDVLNSRFLLCQIILILIYELVNLENIKKVDL